MNSGLPPLASSPSPLASRRRVVIAINGILSCPGESDGWTDRAVTWLHLHAPDVRAEKFEYSAGPLTRRLYQQCRAEAIARMCNFYFEGGFEVSLIGHSNGCDLIARVLDLTRSRTFRSVYLFAAAADGADFERALDEGQIANLFLYGSANDRALKLAALSQKLGGWLGLGYGSLGLAVRDFADTHANTYAVQADGVAHSTWFERGPRFEQTMHGILANEQIITANAIVRERFIRVTAT